MNLRDIATHLNLSIWTVSTCLSGNPEKARIAEATIRRVRDYASEIGYVPNSLAQKIFTRGDSGVIGILLMQDNSISRNFTYADIAIECLNEANREYLLLSCTQNQVMQTLRHFKSQKIQQVILLGMIPDAALKDSTFLKGMELYILDYHFMGSAPSYRPRYRGGIDRNQLYLALGRLLQEQGYAPIMCDLNCKPEILLQEGLIAQGDILPAPTYSPFKEFFDFGENLAERVLSRRPQAVMIHNDQIATGLCHALLKRGVSIPEDISIIGFNNSSFTSYTQIPLTTIELPILKNLKAVLNHILRQDPLPEEEHQTPRIVCRNTTTEPLNKSLERLND